MFDKSDLLSYSKVVHVANLDFLFSLFQSYSVVLVQNLSFSRFKTCSGILNQTLIRILLPIFFVPVFFCFPCSNFLLFSVFQSCLCSKAVMFSIFPWFQTCSGIFATNLICFFMFQTCSGILVPSLFCCPCSNQVLLFMFQSLSVLHVPSHFLKSIIHNVSAQCWCS